MTKKTHLSTFITPEADKLIRNPPDRKHGDLSRRVEFAILFTYGTPLQKADLEMKYPKEWRLAHDEGERK